MDAARRATRNLREMMKNLVASLCVPGTLAALALLGGCASGTGGGVSPATPPVPTPPSARSTAPSGSPNATPPAVPTPTPPPDTDVEPPGSRPGSPGAQQAGAGEPSGGEPSGEAEGDEDDGEVAGSEDGSRGETGGSGRARTSEERRDILDRELDESLSEFDRKMLEEQETLARQRTSASAIGGGGSGEGAAGGAEGGGTGSGSAAGGSAGGTESETSQPAQRGRNDGGGAGAREPGEPVADESSDAAVRSRIPPDIPDGEDDDIVARQLREAAVEEDDPRLRERLWDEYRRYKGLPVQADEKEPAPDDEEPPQEDPGDRREP